MLPLKIEFTLQPKQSELLKMFGNPGLEIIGYGGPRGGGKSGAIRRIALARRLEYPGTACAIMRRTFPDLQENHIKPFWREFPQLREFYNVQNKEITLPAKAGGGVIAFRYAENADDVEQKKGQEFMDVLVDQAEEWTEAELMLLKTINRWPGLTRACRMGLFFNPGGPGAPFLKRVMVDRAFREHEDGEKFAFLQAYGWDNVEWFRGYLEEHGITDDQFYELSNDERFRLFIEETQYGATLNRMPPVMRVAHLLGDFTSFAGQYFDVFDPAKHTLRPEQMPIEAWSPRWIAVDWGFGHPSAVYWGAQGSDNVTYTYREYLRDQLGPKALAQEIVDRCDGEKISAVYLSPDAFAKRTNERTVADQMGDVFAQNGVTRPQPADNDRVGGWMLMYEALRDGQWVIGENCTNLIKTLPLMSRDPKRVEDCIKFDASGNGDYDGDDSADAARYLLKSHLRPRKKPVEQLRQEELLKAVDFTEMHIRALKFDSRHRLRRRVSWRH